MSAKLHGVFAPVTTPFTRMGAVNAAALEENIVSYAQTSLAGFLALGSNGENKSLTANEKSKVLQIIIKNKAVHQTVMAGCIAESTQESLYLAQQAQDMGCDYLTLLPPFYFKAQMNDRVLYQYFSDIASAVTTPCLLYNAPGFSGGLSLSPKLVAELARHPNIVGIKDSSKGTISSYLLAAPKGFAVLSGTISNFLEALCCGATGGILSLANSFPRQVCQLYNLYESGQYEAFFASFKKLLRVNNATAGTAGVPAVKAMMDLAGLQGGYPRRPLLPLEENEQRRIRAVLIDEGLL